MPRIKLTVKRLYALEQQRLVATQARVQIFVAQQLVATEEISGLTESPVVKYIEHQLPAGQAVTVEWQCPGIAEMTVVEL